MPLFTTHLSLLYRMSLTVYNSISRRGLREILRRCFCKNLVTMRGIYSTEWWRCISTRPESLFSLIVLRKHVFILLSPENERSTDALSTCITQAMASNTFMLGNTELLQDFYVWISVSGLSWMAPVHISLQWFSSDFKDIGVGRSVLQNCNCSFNSFTSFVLMISLGMSPNKSWHHFVSAVNLDSISVVIWSRNGMAMVFL